MRSNIVKESLNNIPNEIKEKASEVADSLVNENSEYNIYLRRLKKCEKKHTYRRNDVGIVWCVLCGHLTDKQNQNVPMLLESEKIVVNKLEGFYGTY